MSGPESLRVLTQGDGYGLIIGGGLGFAALMYIIAKVQDRYTQYKIGSLEEFSVSSHSLKPGFVACGIVSAWTWSATLLISTSITFGAGMSGGWWYGCLGGCVICLFSLLAVKVKENANGAHTFLEIVIARFGRTAHKVYAFYAFATASIVSVSILLGGAYLIHEITGVHMVAISFLIPLSLALYVIIGGLRSTFVCDYLHTILIFGICLGFMHTVYSNKSTSAVIGSVNKMYDLLVAAQQTAPVAGNHEGSYLTFRSNAGVIFLFGSIASGVVGVFLDQGYWQRAIAAQPGTTTKAYLIGGALWFSVPFGFSTALGLAACATYGTDVYPGVGHVLTPEQLAGGLAAPGGAIALLGKTGATLMVVAGYMAVTSAVAAELVAVASLVTFDFYKTYVDPQASGAKLLKIEKSAIFGAAIMLGCWNTAMYYAGLNLTFIFYAQGIIAGGAAVPVALMICWKDLSFWGAVLAPAIAPCVSIPLWVGLAKYFGGEVNVLTMSGNYATLAASITSISLGAIISIGLSLLQPANYDFAGTRNIKVFSAHAAAAVVAHEEKGDGDSNAEETKKSVAFTSATHPVNEVSESHFSPGDDDMIDHMDMKKAWRDARIGGALTTGIPCAFAFILAASGYVFNRAFFGFMVALAFIWVWLAALTCTFMPIFESRTQLLVIFKAILGGKPAPMPADKRKVVTEDATKA